MRSSCRSVQRVVPALEVENTPRRGTLGNVTVTIKPAADPNSFDSQDFAKQRAQRKAARAAHFSSKPKHPALLINGDTLLFDGKKYNLIYAYGGLQIDKQFKADLKAKKKSGSERAEIFNEVKKLVEESSLSGNIIGAS